MYNLIWQSVMWRPGKQRFLISVKNRLHIPPTATARLGGPLGGIAVARFVTALGLRPSSVAN
jgi:hypothetical protein